jgi:hypothetical protein
VAALLTHSRRRLGGWGKSLCATYTDPIVRTALRWAVLLFLVASIAAFALPGISGFSAQLFDSLAAIGAILLVAYGVMTSAAISVAGLGLEETESSRDWLGFAVGIGLAALLAIGAALATANYIRHGHSSDLLCRLGFWASALPIFVLGFLLVVQPVFTRGWQLQAQRRNPPRRNPRRRRYQR